ncbi:protein of unknown function (DUF928) [Rivularia sp. PCC 7116]|uniref:DUF928 domain-containing protein n=1 Tax=Rivularia sp. PCC 7116 TaxID=373994 RepID=UPI00029EF522|nr:DUF928 domain-containing protein [Rivularia sp. PCC 7116]AFY58580.1 protein of unknown function (DUF928) [Rivularia sp. PCC 7116]
MKSKISNQIRFSLILLLTLASFVSLDRPVTARTETQISKNPPKKPAKVKKKQPRGDGRGRPTRRRAMGSRNDCPATDMPLTALIPENKVGKVVEANPTFWFFVPYESSKIPRGEFILQDEADNNVYKTEFSMEKGKGIVGVSLASDNSYALKTNKTYQWYFKLYCDRDKSSIPIYVHGWVQRVALQPQQQTQLNRFTPSQRIAFYAQNGIWYSALTESAKLRLSNFQNKDLAKDWMQLLRNVGLQDISNKPIVGNIN